jgi:hypothetical protein
VRPRTSPPSEISFPSGCVHLSCVGSNFLSRLASHRCARGLAGGSRARRWCARTAATPQTHSLTRWVVDRRDPGFSGNLLPGDFYLSIWLEECADEFLVSDGRLKDGFGCVEVLGWHTLRPP